jgi:hypothetical protein
MGKTVLLLMAYSSLPATYKHSTTDETGHSTVFLFSKLLHRGNYLQKVVISQTKPLG